MTDAQNLIIGAVGLLLIFGFAFIISANTFNTINQDLQVNSTVGNQTSYIIQYHDILGRQLPGVGTIIGALILIIFITSIIIWIHKQW